MQCYSAENLFTAVPTALQKEARMAGERTLKYDRMMHLQRKVDALMGELREVQWEMQQKREPFWKGFGHNRHGSQFMSAVCNRPVRPNIKATEEERLCDQRSSSD
jgi:hypothetical protein